MRAGKKLALLALTVASIQFAGVSVNAQAPAAPSKFAVIDVGYIVKNHPAIKQQQTQMRNQVKASQEELIKRRETLVKEAEKLRSLTEGTAEFNQLQEKLAREEAQLKLDMVRKEKELDEIGAKMAISFYEQLQGIIKNIAEFNQIELVLQSNREAPDLKQPATIQMALEKGVVYHKPELDLTMMVLEQIKASMPAGSTTAAPAVQQATAPGANPVRR